MPFRMQIERIIRQCEYMQNKQKKDVASLTELVGSSQLMLQQATAGDWLAVAQTEAIRQRELQQYFRLDYPATKKSVIAHALQDMLAINQKIEALVAAEKSVAATGVSLAMKRAEAVDAYQGNL